MMTIVTGVLLMADSIPVGPKSTSVPSSPTVVAIEASSLDTALVGPANFVVIRQDTPVELMVISEVSTATATPGMIFKLRVNKAVVVNGRTVLPIGTPAFGKVTAAIDSGGLGRSGQMAAKLLHIQLGDAEIPLDGETSTKGQGAGSAGVAVLFGGVLGLFHRGNNAKIKAGELLSGYVAADFPLDLSGPRARRAASVNARNPAPVVVTK